MMISITSGTGRAARVATIICAAAALPLFGVNPITPEGEFLSDPAPRKGSDGALYLFGSRDELSASGAYCSHFNDVFETRDLRAWKIRRGVLASVGANDGIPASDAPLYAPDAIFHDGKWRIFYCMPDKSHREGVASADTIAGPFKTTFAYSWAKQIDPSIFRDDDGTLYYFWGQFSAKGAVLKPDLSGIQPGTLHEGVIDEARHNFHEGIQLTKRGGTYYLVFADVARHGRPTCIGYATSDKPFGPYTYRGVIVDNFGCDPDTWNNHGGIVEQDGNVNLCEMKFYRTPYEITAEEEAKLLNRREAFRADTWTTANCRITVIAAEGIKPGVHASVAQNTLTLDDLPILERAGIDNSLFVDDAGRSWMVYVHFDRGNTIWLAELEKDWLHVKLGTARMLFRADTPWEGDAITEGPFVVKIGAKYVLTYSGRAFWEPDYAVGYALADKPEGPWRKSALNPILRRFRGLRARIERGR